MPFSAPRTSLRNALINAVTTLFHLPALLILPSGAAVCAQHMEYLRGRPAIPQTQSSGPHAGSQVDTIFITFRFWAYLVLFWQSLLRCCSSRSNFWRLGTLRDRFWKGSGLVLEGFLVGFLG